MALATPSLSMSYFSDLCQADMHPAVLVDILSELEHNAQIDTNTLNPETLKLLSTFYTVYLLCLVHDRDLNEARFLTQRIPTAILADAQLSNAVSLLRALYTRNYPAVYVALESPKWSDLVKPLCKRFQDDFRKMTFQLLSRAYTSITPESAAFYLGLVAAPDGEMVKALVAGGWEYDSAAGLLKPSVKYERDVSGSTRKDERIGRLTALVTHLGEA
ncbi:COP9 signalosome [Tricharina praecox]|uniref:COP9 signalosome n=1 Tax=Tricharina praecox TaxID=43433 RepID=UPI002220EF0A|nr:COP9 signalosome [Tricharina praecox]KAI5849036.1 COP9 signalosome [Tricharina praecox]